MFKRLSRALLTRPPGCPGLQPERKPNRQCLLLLGLGLFLYVCALPAQEKPDAAAAAMDARLDQLFGEHASYHVFLAELQAAVAADERPRVAGLVQFPLRTRIDGRVVRLHTQEEFLSHYDALLPPATRARLAAQTYAGLFANSQGAMVGDGQIWFAAVCSERGCGSKRVRIIAFNP
ncbi:MAG: hypothetical protein JSS29_01060 [Proteobacteria bacterium]|nr:hypothetical protein [Pseudomonadota bacterium]